MNIKVETKPLKRTPMPSTFSNVITYFQKTNAIFVTFCRKVFIIIMDFVQDMLKIPLPRTEYWYIFFNSLFTIYNFSSPTEFYGP